MGLKITIIVLALVLGWWYATGILEFCSWQGNDSCFIEWSI